MHWLAKPREVEHVVCYPSARILGDITRGLTGENKVCE